MNPNFTLFGMGPAVYGSPTGAAMALYSTPIAEVGAELVAVSEACADLRLAGAGGLEKNVEAFRRTLPGRNYPEAFHFQSAAAKTIGRMKSEDWRNVLLGLEQTRPCGSSGWALQGGLFATPRGMPPVEKISQPRFKEAADAFRTYAPLMENYLDDLGKAALQDDPCRLEMIFPRFPSSSRTDLLAAFERAVDAVPVAAPEEVALLRILLRRLERFVTRETGIITYLNTVQKKFRIDHPLSRHFDVWVRIFSAQVLERLERMEEAAFYWGTGAMQRALLAEEVAEGGGEEQRDAAQELFAGIRYGFEQMVRIYARLRRLPPYALQWLDIADERMEKMMALGLVSSDPRERYAVRNLQQGALGLILMGLGGFGKSLPLDDVRSIFERMAVIHERAAAEVPSDAAPELFFDLLQKKVSFLQQAGYLFGLGEAWDDAAKALDLALKGAGVWMAFAAARRDLDEMKTAHIAFVSMRDLRFSALKRGEKYGEALSVLLEMILYWSVMARIMTAPHVLQKEGELLDAFHALMDSLGLAEGVDEALREMGTGFQFQHSDGSALHWSEVFLRHHGTILELLRSRRDSLGGWKSEVGALLQKKIEGLERAIRGVGELPPALVAGVETMTPVWENGFLIFREGGSEVRIPMDEGKAQRGIERFFRERRKRD